MIHDMGCIERLLGLGGIVCSQLNKSYRDLPVTSALSAARELIIHWMLDKWVCMKGSTLVTLLIAISVFCVFGMLNF